MLRSSIKDSVTGFAFILISSAVFRLTDDFINFINFPHFPLVPDLIILRIFVMPYLSS